MHNGKLWIWLDRLMPNAKQVAASSSSQWCSQTSSNRRFPEFLPSQFSFLHILPFTSSKDPNSRCELINHPSYKNKQLKNRLRQDKVSLSNHLNFLKSIQLSSPFDTQRLAFLCTDWYLHPNSPGWTRTCVHTVLIMVHYY